MFDLERAEKRIIIFLTSTLLVASGIVAYNKSKPAAKIRIEKFSVEKMPVRPPSAVTADASAVRININEADVKELTGLNGIGDVLARRIVEYRSSKGRFSRPEEIKDVRGIGEALYGKIKDSIAVE